MVRKFTFAITATAILICEATAPLGAQTRPTPPSGTVTMPEPTPLPQPLPERPTPLPQPLPERPTPLPERPQVQPPRPTYPGGSGFANSVRCESRNNRLERCNVRTENRVDLVRRHNGTCTQGRTWGYNQRSIWVSSNCRATFAYGFGSYRPDRGGSSGPSTGAIIGGVAVAAGLVALLANRGSSRDSAPPVGSAPPPPAPTPTPAPVPPAQPPAPFPPGPPAAISADLSSLPADSRPSMQTCMFEAARQVGATGGTKLRFDRLVHIEPGVGGWRFRAEFVATYPDGDRTLPIFCRATPTQVVQLDFTS